MLRRPPTSIELKLNDILEYEEMCRQMSKDKADKSSTTLDVPTWQSGPKDKQEVYNRVGYIPERPARSQMHSF